MKINPKIKAYAIIALIATVATPAIISLSNKIKGNMYDTKVKLIKQQINLWK